MIQVQTSVQVIDNSGVVMIQCIRLLRGSKKNTASVGNYIVGSVKKIFSTKLQKKNKSKKGLSVGDICKALVVCENTFINRLQTVLVRSDKNSVVLVADNYTPIASRVVGPVFLELRGAKQLKVLSLAEIII